VTDEPLPTLPDLLRPGLAVVFVGFNPSVYAALKGHYYARPSNRFYYLLHEAGFTPRRYRPDEDRDLLALGIGITDIVKRPTPAAADLSRKDFAEGRLLLTDRLLAASPCWIGINGKGVAANLLGRPVDYGPAGDLGSSRLFVLPNTSGLAAGMLLREKVAWWRQLASLAGFLSQSHGK
jgi:TDG/mug DNA glycosylase family protein